MILETEGVTKRFGGLVALDEVSLGVEEGEIFGLIGPNGAGKTTLLNVIAGVHQPNAGLVKFKGEEITGSNPETICRKGISRTFQISQPFPKMTALENVLVATYFGNRIPIPDPEAWAGELLDFVGFHMSRDTLARNLNTVELKRLDLARALASKPQLLLLDEIAAGLTPAELLDLMKLIEKIRGERGVTIILVEHVMRMIIGTCERIAVLHYGQKIAEGYCEEVTKDKRVVDAYLGEKYLL